MATDAPGGLVDMRYVSAIMTEKTVSGLQDP